MAKGKIPSELIKHSLRFRAICLVDNVATSGWKDTEEKAWNEVKKHRERTGHPGTLESREVTVSRFIGE
ncbi:MAG: hypothetical protein IPN76_17010 [Saprospiraceae bacterium]|nr:hypothetical protein [Saprospiraceae bacterium]